MGNSQNRQCEMRSQDQSLGFARVFRTAAVRPAERLKRFR